MDGQVDGVIVWPESAISAASALEKFAHEFHDTDHHKYNLKMRQLDFNLKVLLNTMQWKLFVWIEVEHWDISLAL